jgi:hypothetical protein
VRFFEFGHRRVGLARWAGPAAFSGGTLSCTKTSDSSSLVHAEAFRPLYADGAAAAQRPYLAALLPQLPNNIRLL